MSRIWFVVVSLLYLAACNRQEDTIRAEATGDQIVVQDASKRRMSSGGTPHNRRNGIRERRSSVTVAGHTTVSAEAHVTSNTIKTAEVFLRGRVQNEGGGPVPHAKLTLFENVTSGSITGVHLGRDGRFKTAVEMQKNYTFRADAKGYAPAISEAIVVTTATVGDEINLVLSRGRSVSGAVVDAAGEPVPGATVTAMVSKGGEFGAPTYDPSIPGSERTGVARVQSGADGTFEIERLPVDQILDLAAASADYAHAGNYRLNPEDADTSGVQLRLPATGAVTGIVYDQEGNPLPGATVTAMVGILPTRWSDKAETEQDGRFKIDKAPTSASAFLIVSKDKYGRHLKHNAAIDVPLSFTLHRNEPCTVTVTCLDAVTLERVTSVSLHAHNTSDMNTNPQVHQVEAGLFEVESRIDADMFIIAESDQYDSTLLEVKPKSAQENVQLLFARPARISGRIIDAVSRKPVKGAKISTRRQAVEGSTTGEDGRFEFAAKVEHHKYFAVAPDERFSRDFQPVFAAGKTVDVGDIEVAGNAGITVSVVKGAKQEPVRGTQVLIRNASSGKKEVVQQGFTNYDGQYEFEVEPRSRIQIELPEWNVLTDVHHEPQVERCQVKLVVGGAVIKGQIISEGKPRAGTVSGRHMEVANAQFSNVGAGSDGEFEVANLLPGNWELSASTEADWMRGRRQVEVQANKITEVAIDVGSANRKIKGRVIDEVGNPTPGIRVGIEATNANGGVEADGQGRFETWPVEPGKCELQAVDDKLGRSKVVTVQVPRDDEEVPEVELVVKRGSGRVSCTILSLLDGLPINAGYIILEENGQQIAREAAPFGRTGDAVIKNILIGDYTLKVSGPGYEQKTKTLRIEDNSDIHLVEVLSPAADVAVHIKDSNGYYASSANVTLIPLDQDSTQAARTATTDAQGVAAFGPTPYGSYQIEAAGASGGIGSATISTMAQREVKADITLKAAAE